MLIIHPVVLLGLFWAPVKCLLLVAAHWEGTIFSPNQLALLMVMIPRSLLPIVGFLLLRTARWF